MKLQYNATRWISTADLHITCDPPILFKVKTRLSPEWARLQNDWEEQGAEDVGIASELIARAFISVAQGDEEYPLGNRENVDVMRKSLERGSPGEADKLICHIVLGFALHHYRFLALNSAASGRLSPPLNGTHVQSTSKTGKVKA